MNEFIVSVIWIAAWIGGLWFFDAVVGLKSYALWATYGAVMAMILDAVKRAAD